MISVDKTAAETSRYVSCMCRSLQHVEFRGMDAGPGNAIVATRRSVTVTSCEGSGVVAPGKMATWNDVPMLIPQTAPSRLAGCNIINLSYVLKVC